MKKILSIIAFTALLTACAREKKGVIVNKHIVPAYTSSVYDAPIQMYEEKSHPAIYQVRIVINNGDTLTYDVSKVEYDRLQVGQEYTYATMW